MAIAFFDLDKTIISENSAKLWLKNVDVKHKIPWRKTMKASYWLFKYHLGFTNFHNVITESAQFMKGEHTIDVERTTKKFFEEVIKKRYRPGALQAILEHQNKGHVLALLTSSFDTLSNLVAKDLKLDHCLCTKLKIDNEFYTGDLDGTPCFGEYKIQFASKLCSDLGESFKNAFFYTDSASDIPLLCKVKHPVAVNPDPRLRVKATLKGWQIADFGEPL